MSDFIDWGIVGTVVLVGVASFIVLRGYHRRIPRFIARSPFFRQWSKELKSISSSVQFWRNATTSSKDTSTNFNSTKKGMIVTHPKIFINYRRKDTKSEARLLYQKLVAKFPRENVMMDIDSIPPGEDFREYLRDSVKECDVFLALVGSRWLEFGDLNNPNDWVRIEIEEALRLGKRVIPIAIDNAHLPSENLLPASLKSFSSRNALPLDPGRDFNFHMIRIIGAIRTFWNNHSPK